MPASPRTIHAKRLGNRALALARAGTNTGNIEVGGQVKRIRQYERGRLLIRYVFPLEVGGGPQIMGKSSRPTERQIEAVFDGTKVLRIAWDQQCSVVITYKPGIWERALHED
jgi:hypothetical protein